MHGQLVRTSQLDRKWQKFAAPVLEAGDVDTFMTTFDRPADLGGNAIDVDQFQRLRTRWFGRDANNETAAVQFTGWYEDGPGHLIGEVAMVLGNHQPNTTFPDDMPRLKGVFDPAATWFEVDTYTLTSNPESVLAAVSQADSTAWLTLDLTNALYRWILAEINVVTATEVGGIFVPIG